jgi:protein-tyrosine phosphatase
MDNLHTTDIHNHILPDVDDGSASLEESAAMAELALRDGIGTIVATPHHANGRYSNEAHEVREAVTLLNQYLSKQGIPLTVLPGQEVRIYADLIQDLEDGKLLTLGGSRYLLLELPTGEIPSITEDTIHELLVRGCTPIIAHPERNRAIAADPGKLADLIELGALSQITSHSINGLFGKKIQELSIKLCKQEMVHFIASDAHNRKERAFGVRETFEFLAKEIGPDLVEYYRANAEHVVSNSPIEVSKPNWSNKKWFQFWKK